MCSLPKFVLIMEAKLKEIAENFSPFSWTQTATPKLLSFRGKYFTMELKIFSKKSMNFQISMFIVSLFALLEILL